MDDQLIDTPEALDAAIEASVQSRHAKLMRVARGEGFGLADVLLGLVVLLAFGEIAIEPKRALYSVAIACLSVASMYTSRRARRKAAIDALNEVSGR